MKLVFQIPSVIQIMSTLSQLIEGIFQRLLVFRNQNFILLNKLLILCCKPLYHFYLCRKSLILLCHGLEIFLRLIYYRGKLVAKHGRNWRSCMGSDEVVNRLQLGQNVHNVSKKTGLNWKVFKVRVRSMCEFPF